jgi:hypothetical protein
MPLLNEMTHGNTVILRRSTRKGAFSTSTLQNRVKGCLAATVYPLG